MVRNRGQLLLIGAVLIGLTIISTVVMLNGMQYADSAGARSQSQVLDDGERTEEMVERDLERLVVQVQKTDPSNPADALRENISVYDNSTRNMTVSRGGPTVNVTLNGSASRGKRFQYASTSNFKPSSSTGNDWDMATDVDHLRRFDVHVDGFNGVGASSAFVIVVDVDGGGEWRFRMFEESGSPPRDVVIETQPPGSGTWTTRCSDEGPPVELNFLTGEAYYSGPDTTCSFPSVGAVASTPYTITFEDSQKAHGEFDVLVDGEDTPESNSASSDYPVIPAVDYQYRSTDIAYNRTIWIEGGAT